MDVGPEGADPGAAARLSGRAVARGGRVARAQVGARPAAAPTSSSGCDELDAGWRRRVQAAAAGAASVLRYVATVTPSKIAVGLRRGADLESARRDQGLGQPARVHDGALQGQPARHHRPRRRRGGHRGGRAERHPAPGGRMSAAGPGRPPSRPGGVGNVGPGLDILGLAVDGAGDEVRAEWTREPGIQVREPGHPSLPRDPARHTVGARRARGARRRGRAARRRPRHRALGHEGAAALGRPGRQRRLGGGGRGGGRTRCSGAPLDRAGAAGRLPRRRGDGRRAGTWTTSRRRCSAASC